MIDFSRLRLIADEIATIGVGDKLSRLDASGNPSIIREYSAVKEPPYPFLTYDVRHVGGEAERATNQYFDNEGRKWHEFTENIDIKYCCKGDRSLEIISQLYNFVKLPSTRDRVTCRMPGFGIVKTMSIKPSPTVNGTIYIEEHSFIIRCYLINKVLDPYDFEMERITLSTSFSNNVSTTSDFNVEIPITPSVL